MKGLKLTDLKIGQRKKVLGFVSNKIAGKLMAMGMIPGSEIEMVRIAFAGNTYYIKFNGYNLAIRKNEAQEIVLN